MRVRMPSKLKSLQLHVCNSAWINARTSFLDQRKLHDARAAASRKRFTNEKFCAGVWREAASNAGASPMPSRTQARYPCTRVQWPSCFAKKVGKMERVRACLAAICLRVWRLRGCLALLARNDRREEVTATVVPLPDAWKGPAHVAKTLRQAFPFNSEQIDILATLIWPLEEAWQARPNQDSLHLAIDKPLVRALLCGGGGLWQDDNDHESSEALARNLLPRRRLCSWSSK